MSREPRCVRYAASSNQAPVRSRPPSEPQARASPSTQAAPDGALDIVVVGRHHESAVTVTDINPDRVAPEVYPDLDARRRTTNCIRDELRREQPCGGGGASAPSCEEIGDPPAGEARCVG